MIKALKPALLATIIVLLSFSALSAAERDLILSVKVKGNEKIESALIIATANLEVGGYLQEEKVSTAIKNLNQLSVFNSIAINKEEVIGGV